MSAASKRVKCVAFAYEYDASNLNVQSGRPHSLLQEFRRRVAVCDAFDLNHRLKYLSAGKKLLSKIGALGNYNLEREPLNLRSYARQVMGNVSRSAMPVDMIFCPSTLVPTHLKTSIPIVMCNDTPFSGLIGYNPYFSNLSKAYVERAYAQEAAAHRNATLVVYPSTWARDLAIDEHGCDPEKIIVHPFGANLPYDLPADWLSRRDQRAGRCPITFLLISSDFERKGGAALLGLIDRLRAMGQDARCIVVGEGEVPSGYGRAIGRVDKRSPEGAARFLEAMTDSDFVILPSHREAFGMSLVEGSSHGLPMIGRAVGGITSIINDGVTGLLFENDKEIPLLANEILEVWNSPELYSQMSVAAKAFAEREANWSAFVDHVLSEIETRISEGARQ